MAVPYELIVAEDLNRGYGTVPVTMPGGGTATGTQIGIHTYIGPAWLNVKDFGAQGDGVADDTVAIQTAAAALPATGGVLFFPSGTYLTTGLVFTDVRVDLVGSGAGGEAGIPSNGFDGASIIKSVSNASIIKYTMATRSAGALHGRWSMVRDLCVLGNSTGSSQHGLQIDNRGVHVRNVSIAYCGGNGIQLTDSVNSVFVSVFSTRNVGHGIYQDDSSTTAGGGSVNYNKFFGCAAGNNGGCGVRIVFGTGFTSYGMDISSNTSHGIDLGQSGTRPAYGCRFYATWDEANGGDCVVFEAGSRHNFVEFIRYSSGAPNDAGTANSYWAVDDTANPTVNTWNLAGTQLTNTITDNISVLKNNGQLLSSHFGDYKPNGAPTIQVGAAAGNGPTLQMAGSDVAGEVQLSTGTGAGTGVLWTVTFARTFKNQPTVFVTPANADTATDFLRVNVPFIGDTNGPTLTTFALVATTALRDTITYKWRYFVVERN